MDFLFNFEKWWLFYWRVMLLLIHWEVGCLMMFGDEWMGVWWRGVGGYGGGSMVRSWQMCLAVSENRGPPKESEFEEILLIEEILHQLIYSLSHYFQGFIYPRWCRISSINWEVFGFKHCLVLHPADHPHWRITYAKLHLFRDCYLLDCLFCCHWFLHRRFQWFLRVIIIVYPVSIRWVLSNIEYRKCSNFANYY